MDPRAAAGRAAIPNAASRNTAEPAHRIIDGRKWWYLWPIGFAGDANRSLRNKPVRAAMPSRDDDGRMVQRPRERGLRRDETMAGLPLLVTVTALYAGYNLLIKVSASHVPVAAMMARAGGGDVDHRRDHMPTGRSSGDLDRVRVGRHNPRRTGAATVLKHVYLGGGRGPVHRRRGDRLFLSVRRRRNREADDGERRNSNGCQRDDRHHRDRGVFHFRRNPRLDPARAHPV